MNEMYLCNVHMICVLNDHKGIFLIVNFLFFFSTTNKYFSIQSFNFLLFDCLFSLCVCASICNCVNHGVCCMSDAVDPISSLQRILFFWCIWFLFSFPSFTDVILTFFNWLNDKICIFQLLGMHMQNCSASPLNISMWICVQMRIVLTGEFYYNQLLNGWIRLGSLSLTSRQFLFDMKE